MVQGGCAGCACPADSVGYAGREWHCQREDIEMSSGEGELSRRYEEVKHRVWRKGTQQGYGMGMEAVFEARRLGEGCNVYEKREVEDYQDIAAMLLVDYPPEFAFYVARQFGAEYASTIKYIPTPYIMRAVERIDELDPSHRTKERSEKAAQTLAAAICSLTDLEDARETFDSLSNPGMRDAVRKELYSLDEALARHIAG